MARQITEIKQEITKSFVANEQIVKLYGLTGGKLFEEEFSKVSLESSLFDIVAFSIWTLEKVFDIHKKEIDTALLEQKRGSLSWYRTMALNFQYGSKLITDSDQYDTAGKTAEQIQISRIVKYAAVTESKSTDRESSRVIIKIAGEEKSGEDTVLYPITEEQKISFDTYINEIKFAGVQTTVINYKPDRLHLDLVIYRDPLVLNSTGGSIANAGKPVVKAIKEYMKELPFNGELVLAHLIDKLQQVEGVLIPHIVSAHSSWIDPSTGKYGKPELINVIGIPESGYYEALEEFIKIIYK